METFNRSAFKTVCKPTPTGREAQAEYHLYKLLQAYMNAYEDLSRYHWRTGYDEAIARHFAYMYQHVAALDDYLAMTKKGKTR